MITLTTFVLVMLLYPDAQIWVQEELDRVIGKDRLPRFADRENLPYLEALIKEVHRWNPVTPLGASNSYYVACMVLTYL